MKQFLVKEFLSQKNFNKLTFVIGVNYVVLIAWFDRLVVQRSIDGGSLYANQIKYPDDSIVAETTLGLFTLLHQFSGILIFLIDDVYYSSFIIQIVSLFIFFIGIYLLSKTMGLGNYFILFSLFMWTSAIPYFFKDFTNVYPLIFRGEHTYGIYGITLCILSIALLSSKKVKLLGFVLPIFLVTQVAWAIWFVLIATLSLVIVNIGFNLSSLKEFIKGSFISLPFSVATFIHYLRNLSEQKVLISNDKLINELWISYINFWDYHRSLDFDFKSVYLNLIGFIVILILRLKIKLDMKNNFIIVFYLICNFVSTALYYVNDFLLENKFIFLSSLMPGRFMNLNIFLLFLILFFYLTKILKSLYYSNLVVSLLFITLYFYPGLIPKINFDPTLPKIMSDAEIDLVCGSFKFPDRQILTLGLSSRLVPLHCKHPILLDSTQIDFIAYNSHKLENLSEVLDNVYGVNFKDPRNSWESTGQVIRPTGSVDEKIVKSNWEFRNSEHWEQLSCKFNFTEVVTDSSIILRLPILYKNDFLTVYTIENSCTFKETYLEVSSNVPAELTKNGEIFQWITTNGLKIYLFNSSEKELDIILNFRLTPNPCKISQELVMNHNGLSKPINIESQSFTERINLRLKTGDEWSLEFVPSILNLTCKIPNDERNLVSGFSQLKFNIN
jgi:hypothetical protein